MIKLYLNSENKYVDKDGVVQKVLHIPMNGEYWCDIKAGTKPLEYRLINAHWIKQLYDIKALEKSKTNKLLYYSHIKGWATLEEIYSELEQREYDYVLFKLGYPKRDDWDKIIVEPYRGYEVQTIVHPHFGSEPVEVFAIYTN